MSPGYLRGWALAIATTGVVVATDQITKAAATARIDRGETENVFLGIDVSNVRNTGVAFGALSGGGALLVIAIAVALGLLVVYFARNATVPLLWLPVGLVLGGSVGNLADRARDGAVTDFIDPVFWPAFNFADIAIVVGILALLYVAERSLDTDE